MRTKTKNESSLRANKRGGDVRKRAPKGIEGIVFLGVLCLIPLSCGEQRIGERGPPLSISDPLENSNLSAFEYAYTGNCDDTQPITITPASPDLTIISSSCSQGGLYIKVGFKSGSGRRSIEIANGGTRIIRSVNFEVPCPAGFVGVPKNPEVETFGDFCIAKYEMKAETDPDGTDEDQEMDAAATLDLSQHRPEARPNGIPWGHLTREEAGSLCNKMGWTLLTNAQWQTIARNIESNSANWIQDSAALRLPRGVRAIPYSRAVPLEASPDDSKGCYGIASDGSCETLTWITGLDERRTHTLTNGEVIWDVGGNVAEWIADTISESDETGALTPVPDLRLLVIGEYTDRTYFPANQGNSRRFFAPLNIKYGSSHGMGQLLSGFVNSPYSGAILRGGDAASGVAAGIFAANLTANPNDTQTWIGFRCAVILPKVTP